MDSIHHDMSGHRPLILLSNDDGFSAQGIKQLTEMVADMGDVWVVAPEGARSGASMSFTGSVPLRLRQVSDKEQLHIYSCTGTPCDCVKLAIGQLLPRRPDLVLSGINHGDNAAINAHYSGTVAIALEGTMKGVPSIAFSSKKLSADADFSALRPSIREIVNQVLSHELPRGTCLNVNYPDKETFEGIRICRMGMGDWVSETECRTDPRNRTYFWMAGSYESYDSDDECTDTWALDHDYIAITPIQLDMTARNIDDFAFLSINS